MPFTAEDLKKAKDAKKKADKRTMTQIWDEQSENGTSIIEVPDIQKNKDRKLFKKKKRNR